MREIELTRNAKTKLNGYMGVARVQDT